jgi:hypothetical protein
MVKSPKIRHSKPGGEPLTIELSGDDVKRVDPTAEPGKPAEAATQGQGPTTSAATAASPGTKSAEPASAPKPSSAAATAPSAAKSAEAAQKPATAASSASASGPKVGSAQPYASSSSAVSSASDTSAKPAAATSSFGRDAGKGTATPPPPPSSPRVEPSKPEPKAEPAPRRSGSVMLAGLLGGVIALGGAGAAWYGGLIQLPAQPAAPAAPAQPDNTAVDALRAELASLRAAIDELRATPPAPAEAPDLTNVNARIESLATLVEDLRAQLAGIGEGAGGSPADVAALAALREQIAALEARIAALPAEGGADLSGLREEIGAASALARQASDAATQAATAAGALAPRIDKIENDLAALTAQVAEAAEKPGVALAIAASALKAAVDRGQPFVTELDTYAGLAPDTPEIAALRPYAETGVPTRADIEARFDAAASAMIAAGRTDDAEAGFFERLWGSAMSVVEVRPIGEVAGDDAPAVVARMEVALTRGDYARAIAEFDTLPEPSRNAGAALMESVRARHAADDLVGKVLAAALRA